MTCFICGAIATHCHRDKDNHAVRINFCEDCLNKAKVRHDYISSIRICKGRKHLIVKGVQACQKRQDKIKERTDSIHEVTCGKCLMALYKFGRRNNDNARTETT